VLRGCAALSVLCFHVWLYRPQGQPGPRHSLSAKVLFELNLGLICFFVLSGFLLYRGFVRAMLSGREVNLRRYALRRAARILPAYYVCLAGSLLLYEAVGAGSLVPPPHQLVLFAVFAQSYSTGTFTAIDAVTWTLCVEVLFYLLLPVFAALASRVGPRRHARQVLLLCSLLAVSVVWNGVVSARGWGPVAAKSLPAYLGAFACGMLVALELERRRRPIGRLAAALLALAGMAIVIFTGFGHEQWGSHTLEHRLLADLPAAVGFALIVAAVAGRAPAERRRVPPALAGLGVISYGLYLWHIPLILVLLQLGLLPTALLARLVVVALGAGVLATLSWRCVERPALRWAHRSG
jgi:peptidoglycan/LPS O-acetylase OafA/YrhL